MRTRLVVRRAQLISKLCWQQTSDCVIINFISLFHVTLSTRPYWKSKQHTYTAELGCWVHSADPRSEMCVAPSTVYMPQPSHQMGCCFSAGLFLLLGIKQTADALNRKQ
jgi:hypothetical protein